MKKHLLTLVLLLALLPMAKAQESGTWCPPGAVWHYTVVNELGFSFCLKLIYNGDEMVNDILCKRISRESCIDSKNATSKGSDWYTYEEHGVVFFFDPEEQTFDTLYNFNACIGDQWGASFWGTAVNITVLDTSSVKINEFTLKQLRLYYYCGWGGFQEEIIVCERIGNMQGHLFSILGECIWDTEEATGVLRCYQDDEFPLYNTGIAPYCDYVSINETEPYSQLSIFPNPANGEEITITFPKQVSRETEITISDMLGKTVKTIVLGQNGGKISVAGLSAGVYLLSAKNGKNVFKREKLIVP